MNILRPGPLRNGNPRGNPNLAPRCNAACRTRGGAPCRSPAMKNGRCRMHGGASTGPRTDAGLRRIRAAATVHRLYAKPEAGAFLTSPRVLVRNIKVTTRLLDLGASPLEARAVLGDLPIPAEAMDLPPAIWKTIGALSDALAERLAEQEKTRDETPCTVKAARPGTVSRARRPAEARETAPAEATRPPAPYPTEARNAPIASMNAAGWCRLEAWPAAAMFTLRPPGMSAAT